GAVLALDRLRTKNGDTIWLTAPVKKAPLDTPICEIEISEERGVWRRKLFACIEQNLSKNPHWSSCREFIESWIFDSTLSKLSDLNIQFIESVSKQLGLSTQFRRSSELAVTGKRTDKLLGLCQHFDASRYLSNAGSAVYLEDERARFEEIKVELVFHSWEHPVYNQNGSGFVSHLSVVDPLACLGWNESTNLINVSQA
ncbi:MAG: WbqC family protein, partial [Verrucomicrobiota bacterium]